MTEPSPLPGEPRFVERLLAERIGLDVASVGSTLIERGIAKRMRQLGVTRAADYERILLGPTDEVQALIEEVVIPESWFFRDDRPFAAFRDLVREGWLTTPERDRLSVLCLPCASGEEPYSVVMTLMELGLPRPRFEVVAIDISERSLDRAARGIYGSYAFRGVADSIRSRYFDFTETAGRYLLKASVRSAVLFERGNLLDSNLLGKHPGFDVIFCRNLLIYFDDAARVQAFANLDRLARGNGFLFLGHADRPDANLTQRFLPHGDAGSFLYRKRSVTSTQAVVAAPRQSTSPAPARPIRPTPDRAARITPAAAGPRTPPRRTIEFEDTANASSSPALTTRSPRDAILTEALALADKGHYEAATALIRGEMGRGVLDASAHFLLGMIHQAAGHRDLAEAELLKALYLDPDHDEALLDLALLARRRGDVAAESLYRRRAERVRARKERT